MTRKSCPTPETCTAPATGRCAACHPRSEGYEARRAAIIGTEVRRHRAVPEHRQAASERAQRLWADPAYRAQVAAAREANADTPEARERRVEARATRRPVAVPPWAERAGLSDVYREIARRNGEHEAAAHCRRLKAEAAGQVVLS